MVLNEVPGKVFHFQNLAIFKQVHQRIIAVEVQNIIYVVCGLNKLPGSETEIVSLEEISQAAFYTDQGSWFIVPYFHIFAAFQQIFIPSGLIGCFGLQMPQKWFIFGFSCFVASIKQPFSTNLGAGHNCPFLLLFIIEFFHYS
jgi:hypothetical protein